LLLTARAIFLLEHGQHTHKVTDATDHHTHSSTTASVGNNQQ